MKRGRDEERKGGKEEGSKRGREERRKGVREERMEEEGIGGMGGKRDIQCIQGVTSGCAELYHTLVGKRYIAVTLLF
jgi:hypothetical protein